MQDVTLSTPGICDDFVDTKEMKVSWGQSVHLSCPVQPSNLEILIDKFGPLKWYYYRSDRSTGYEVFARKDKFIHTTDNGLVIIGITEREKGRYECKVGSNVISRYDLVLDKRKWSFSFIFLN